MIQVRKVFNANIYTDGTNNHVGRASEIKLPELQVQTQEHKALGMIGTLELPSGLGALAMSVKWAGFYDEPLLLSNPFESHKWQVRGNAEVYGPGGRTEQVPVVVHVTCSSKKASLGTYKPQESSEYDDEFAVTYLKVLSGTRELIEVDVYENIWKVDGVDVLEQLRANLGV